MRREICVGAQGITPRVDDIVAVSNKHVDVVLDCANLTRVKKESPAPKAFARDTAGLEDLNSSEQLPTEISRAATFCVLVRLATGTSGCRAVVLQTLQMLLAQTGISWALPRAEIDSDALAAFPVLLNGDLSALGIADAKAAADLGVAEPPGFNAAERLQLLSGSPVSCGALALAATQAQKILSVSSATLAISCEALKGSSTMFGDMKLPDISASKHVSAVASDVIALLDGSTFTNRKPKDGGRGTIGAVAKGVQAIGSAQYHASAAYDAVRAELMSPATPLPADWVGVVPSAAPLATCALSLAMSATAASALALDRCRQMKDALQAAGVATGDIKEAEEWLEAVECRQRGHRANVGGAAAAVASGAIGDDDDPPPPSLQAAEVAMAAVDILMECCACECLLATQILTAYLADAPADGPPSKKKLALGKGTGLLYRALQESHKVDAGGAVKGHAVALMAPQNVGGLADDLRRVIEANAARRKPKLPKGTKDYLPTDMAVRKRALAAIEAVFERHGAVTIDTPVFELRETLAGKYGEDSKLIYDLADQGGELLSLRYDLTVPFARYVALNGIGHIKRYHIGKVYRRDNPQMNRGRFREFYQCDFDIAGTYPAMVADSEVLRVLHEILTELNIGDFTIKLNHRALLDGIMAIAGVPAAKFRPICSAIDKLDKAPWEEVRREMVEDKGLPEGVADKIGEFVAIKGEPREVLAKLKAREDIGAHEGSCGALEALAELFGFLEAMGALGSVSFDMSLARGLDYYTGVIYEAVLVMGEGPGASVGSIAAGGRYDGLVGMYSGKDVPAVGVSIGVERVFTVLEAKLRAQAQAVSKSIRATKTQVLVGSFGKGLQVERMKLCADLWAAGINAEFGYKRDQNFNKDIVGVAQEHGIPFVVVFGESELAEGKVNVKDMSAATQETVARSDLCAALQDKLKGRQDDIF